MHLAPCLLPQDDVYQCRHVSNSNRIILVHVGCTLVILIRLLAVLAQDDIHQCCHVGDGNGVIFVHVAEFHIFLYFYAINL